MAKQLLEGCKIKDFQKAYDLLKKHFAAQNRNALQRGKKCKFPAYIKKWRKTCDYTTGQLSKELKKFGISTTGLKKNDKLKKLFRRYYIGDIGHYIDASDAVIGQKVSHGNHYGYFVYGITSRNKILLWDYTKHKVIGEQSDKWLRVDPTQCNIDHPKGFTQKEQEMQSVIKKLWIKKHAGSYATVEGGRGPTFENLPPSVREKAKKERERKQKQKSARAKKPPKKSSKSKPKRGKIEGLSPYIAVDLHNIIRDIAPAETDWKNVDIGTKVEFYNKNKLVEGRLYRRNLKKGIGDIYDEDNDVIIRNVKLDKLTVVRPPKGKRETLEEWWHRRDIRRHFMNAVLEGREASLSSVASSGDPVKKRMIREYVLGKEARQPALRRSQWKDQWY